MVIAVILALLGAAAVLTLAYFIGSRAAQAGSAATDERLVVALAQQAALLQRQAAELEGRLGMEREHTVTAAAAMAARMAGEKLGDTMSSGARQPDLRTTAFERSDEHTSELQSLTRTSYAALRLTHKQQP